MHSADQGALRTDLHVHSHVSDGHLPPGEVVIAALAGGLDVLALTDHDTAAGVAEAMRAAADTRLRVIAGIEVSAAYQGHQIHVLGYHIDLDSAAVAEHQARSAERREQRMQGMVDRMRDLGATVTIDHVKAEAGESARSLGRPHLARALLASGFTRYYGEAFEKYLRDGGPGFVEADFPEPAEAIDLIHRMGGVAVWAHPDSALFDQYVRPFAGWGLDGVECFRSNHYPEQTQHYLAIAREIGLLAGGGSDWHSPFRGPLGEFAVKADLVAELLEAGDRYVAA